MGGSEPVSLNVGGSQGASLNVGGSQGASLNVGGTQGASLNVGGTQGASLNTVTFCSLQEALELDWRNEQAKTRLKRTPTDYFLLQVLLKFRTEKGRDPLPASYSGDSEVLLHIRNSVMESLGVGPDLIPDDFTSFCFSEMAPVCAVVGGVLAQEIVKGRSSRKCSGISQR
ncbi:SUMO-activating enzyme subunit 1-like [Microcaecilia unicolor]|uniref:SUMO-activating enzyme subunit 1-like n=1 Tax=Microcaecilia unicolor TaxID=1415580 RepID=A0A6P7X6A4_9AMPH|nr:SUMO-activating enzyme subunit 1-like [Microcaecilia unicolor]